MKSLILKCNPQMLTDISFHIYWHNMMQIKKKTANMWEYKFGDYANIGNFACLWKPHLQSHDIQIWR